MGNCKAGKRDEKTLQPNQTILIKCLENFVDKPGASCYNVTCDCEQHTRAAVAQSVERRIGSAEVTGPIPVSSFEKPWLFRAFLYV